MKTTTLTIVVTFIISLCFSSCQRPTEKKPSNIEYTYQVPVQTNDGWETAHLSDVNIHPSPLVQMMREYFGTRTRDVHSILIIKDRKLVFEVYFPEYSHLGDEQKDEITLKHLLTMTSGLEWNEGDIPLTDERNDLSRMIRSSDPIGYILGKPVVDYLV